MPPRFGNGEPSISITWSQFHDDIPSSHYFVTGSFFAYQHGAYRRRCKYCNVLVRRHREISVDVKQKTGLTTLLIRSNSAILLYRYEGGMRENSGHELGQVCDHTGTHLHTDLLMPHLNPLEGSALVYSGTVGLANLRIYRKIFLS